MAGYGTLLTSDEKYNNKSAAKLNRPQPATHTSASDETGSTPSAIVGCANGFADSAAVVPACQVGNISDAFSVTYDVDQHIVGLGSALPTDCLGATVLLSPAILPVNKRSGTAKFYRIENRFFVQNNPITGNPELYCRGNGNTLPGAPFANVAQPVAENVEVMKITYGMSPTEVILDEEGNEKGEKATVQNVNQFLTADLIAPADWSRVVSVRLCIVVRSANDFVVTQKQAYRDCNDAQVVALDRRIRGVFSTTIAIRSRSVGAT
jgi:type IV pilus assembly protein PilW